MAAPLKSPLEGGTIAVLSLSTRKLPVATVAVAADGATDSSRRLRPPRSPTTVRTARRQRRTRKEEKGRASSSLLAFSARGLCSFLLFVALCGGSVLVVSASMEPDVWLPGGGSFSRTAGHSTMGAGRGTGMGLQFPFDPSRGFPGEGPGQALGSRVFRRSGPHHTDVLYGRSNAWGWCGKHAP